MNVETIDLKFQGVTGGIAAFLIRTEEGCLLIETGPESTLPVLLAELELRGLAPEDLRAIFVTHIHLDHAGAAGWFAAKGVPVYVHRRGARHLIDPGRLLASARSVYADRFDTLWGGVTHAPAEKIHVLEDGDRVKIAGIELIAHDTPGHAFHHHVYQIGADVFAGDAAGAWLGGSDYVSLTSAPPQFHLEHTLASIGKIADLHPERLFLTHFDTVSDPPEHLAAYEEVVRLSAEFVHQRMNEGLEGDALAVAYEAYQLERAFRQQVSPARWVDYQAINGTEMCAEGIRMYWESRFADSGGKET